MRQSENPRGARGECGELHRSGPMIANPLLVAPRLDRRSAQDHVQRDSVRGILASVEKLDGQG